jgi:hypothetical protein
MLLLLVPYLPPRAGSILNQRAAFTGSPSFCYQFPEHIQTPLRSAGRAGGFKSTRGSHEYEGPLPDKGRRISGSGSD